MGVRLLSVALAGKLLLKSLRSITQFPAETYPATPSLTLSALDQAGPLGWLALAALAIAFAATPRLRLGWIDLPRGRQLRWLILVAAGALAWEFSTAAYNHAFDRLYAWDRIAAILCVAALWRTPLVIYPSLLVLLPLVFQYHQPIGLHLDAESMPLVHVLVFFACFYLLHGASRAYREEDFPILVLCVIAAYFFVPGFKKLAMGWITHGHVNFMTLAAHAKGWLSFLDTATVIRLAQGSAWLDWPARIAVIALECGALLALAHRSLPRFFLLGWAILLMGFFLAFGYLFWKWLLLIALLGALFFRKPNLVPIRLPHFLVSLLLIGLGLRWVGPPQLAWFDTRLSYDYQFEAIDDSGQSHFLAPAFFAPYEDIFTMGNFGFLSPQPSLTGPYGVTKSRPQADRLLEASDPQAVLALEAETPSNPVSPQAAAVFDDFLQDFIASHNRHPRPASWLSTLHPPPFLWTSPPDARATLDQPIREIVIHRAVWLYDDQSLHLLHRNPIRRIPIPD